MLLSLLKNKMEKNQGGVMSCNESASWRKIVGFAEEIKTKLEREGFQYIGLIAESPISTIAILAACCETLED